MKAQNTVPAIAQQDVENANESKLEVVSFNNVKIPCLLNPNGKIYVALKPIADAIGVQWEWQQNALKNDPILKDALWVTMVRDQSGRQNKAICLVIDMVHGWLFSIDSSKVKASAKPKLLSFKRECYQVLFDHFYGKYRIYEANLSERRKIESLIDEACVQKAELSAKIQAYRKRLKEINESELSGQLQLQVKGGASHE